MQRLCVPPETFGGPPKQAGETPPDIAELVDQVESVRELAFREPVAADPIDDAAMDRKLSRAFEATYPEDFYRRRTQAWRTIGVIGPDDDIRESLLAFQTGQVVGFYNPTDGELVYLSDGDATDSLFERAVLSHELTHAIDDQHFDLTRIDRILERCDDEAFLAALGAVEGSAQHFAIAVITRFPGGSLVVGDDGGLPDDVPPFITELQLWPYTSGQAFIGALSARGGSEEINGAIAEFPTSTEQVIHPERYPDDQPQPVDVADLGAIVGHGWRDLDVMVVGEAWLRAMLELHLDFEDASVAAAGWDGGTYRAWSDGDWTAVVLATVWDSEQDAAEFGRTVRTWLDSVETPGSVMASGADVVVVFGDSTGTVNRFVQRPALARDRFYPKRRVPGDGVEVAIDVQHGRVRSDGGGRDQAVDRAPHGLASCGARPLDRCRLLEPGETGERDEREAEQLSAELRGSAVGSHTSEELEHHGLGDHDVGSPIEQQAQPAVDRRPRPAEQLDPGRRVGQDHVAVSRAERDEPRSPSQPLPSSASMPPQGSSSPTVRRRAKSTASRLVEMP